MNQPTEKLLGAYRPALKSFALMLIVMYGFGVGVLINALFFNNGDGVIIFVSSIYFTIGTFILHHFLQLACFNFYETYCTLYRRGRKKETSIFYQDIVRYFVAETYTKSKGGNITKTWQVLYFQISNNQIFEVSSEYIPPYTFSEILNLMPKNIAYPSVLQREMIKLIARKWGYGLSLLTSTGFILTTRMHKVNSGLLLFFSILCLLGAFLVFYNRPRTLQ